MSMPPDFNIFQMMGEDERHSWERLIRRRITSVEFWYGLKIKLEGRILQEMLLRRERDLLIRSYRESLQQLWEIERGQKS